MLSAAVPNLRAGTAAELWPRLWGGSGEIHFPKLPLGSLGMREREAELADGACGSGTRGIDLLGWEARPHLSGFLFGPINPVLRVPEPHPARCPVFRASSWEGGCLNPAFLILGGFWGSDSFLRGLGAASLREIRSLFGSACPP